MGGFLKMQTNMGPTSPGQGRKFVKYGGLSLILAGILVLLTLPLIPTLLPSLAPPTVLAGLQALQTQGLAYSVTWILYLTSDLLFLVAIPGIYFVFKRASRSVLLIAVVFNTLFVALDVGLDIPLRLYLVQLSNSYQKAAASQLDQGSILSSAQSVMNTSNLVALAATLLQLSAVILVSYAMIKSGRFRRSVGYIGVATGLIAILFVPAFVVGSQLAGLFNIVGFVLLVIWSVSGGLRLRVLARAEAS